MLVFLCPSRSMAPFRGRRPPRAPSSSPEACPSPAFFTRVCRRHCKLGVSKAELRKWFGSLSPKPGSSSQSRGPLSLGSKMEDRSPVPTPPLPACVPLVPTPPLPARVPLIGGSTASAAGTHRQGNVTSPSARPSSSVGSPLSHLDESPHCPPTSPLAPNSSRSEFLGTQI